MSKKPPTPRTNLHPQTIAAQGLGWIDAETGAVVPPIHNATTYARDESYELIGGRSYARPNNPTLEQPEQLLAALEGGEAAALFASGMASAVTLFQSLSPGDHVVAPRSMYWGLRDWLTGEGRRWGLAVDLVDSTVLEAVASAVQPGRTKLIWIETPANPDWGVTDIAGVAAIARRAGAKLAVDNTVPTPVLTRPLALGADFVMHSATKYLNGHTDLLAGALVAARQDDHWQRILALRGSGGAVLGAFEAWLLLRGMRTLFVRVRHASASALGIARHFDGHPKLVEVLYPGLERHPGHAVAARQMEGGFGAMLSLRVKGGAEGALKVAARCHLWVRATSLGGTESLLEHRASVEGPSSPVQKDLLRLSVGLEEPGDLIEDLEQALQAL
ncbi:MAG TPA: PLP-dependent aspartate aminotransferase family protein [Hypericibacter adhaerens]|uniref:trans-sulfuration enzyme family protein n=1 Tax=Hypericibacter adhaerens TaxID=2602016 RepID=UPI002CA1129F|nr:PLP-dependent aspartate aminotransferase family protein [Hypericibacter adhaerens]HWA45472.1 PLP-dependent aspartate aminotransferase family protein [Hypericibacter adhaerens]